MEDGVWRTIGGRRIFIKNGEDIETAMKNSGKFKSAKKDVKKENSKEEIKEEPKEDKKNSELTDEERKEKIEKLEQQKQNTQNIFQKGAIQEKIDMVKDGFDGTKEEYRDYVSKEQERRLEEYKKEKEERQKEFKEQNNVDEDYRMAHRPTETGLTADNLTREDGEVGVPKDIYEHPEYYSSGEKRYLDETMKQLNAVRGNEDGEITIYRATIGDKINQGDWVTLSEEYAKQHNNSQLDGKGNILKMKVKAKDIQFAGDGLEEWGYFPREKPKGNPYMKAYNEYKKEHPNSKITFTKFKEENYE